MKTFSKHIFHLNIYYLPQRLPLDGHYKFQMSGFSVLVQYSQSCYIAIDGNCT